ncbi:MAG: S16 family serine protease, partial [Candidatus Diapherotrites archaeon]|nr:S16 family serine protease [Candidatus Diapherotrites archaeon]
MRKLIALLFLILVFSASVAAVIEKDSLKIFAVTEQGNALSADLTLEIKPGSGNVWSSVEPLVGTSTQTTEKLAVQIAKNYSKEVGSFDYFFGIKSDASLVEGPSAGAAMTLLTISMLQDRKVPDYVGLTGTITPDGGVGSVGGVFEKSKKAAKIGMKLFMIPAGEAKQTVKLPEGVKSINLSSYAKEQWDLLVVEVNDIDDVLHYAFADLESIDVNAEENVLPDFIPNAISFNRQLQPMDSIVRKFIAEADEGINGARSALSGTLLSDPAVVDVLL